MAQREVVDFNLTDGLTPQQIEKLNYNFHVLSGGVSNGKGAGGAIDMAADAFLSAESAQKSADDARHYADEAQQSADIANKSADSAVRDAKIAYDSARQAYGKAVETNLYALAAGSNLAELQNIIGFIEWEAAFGQFQLYTEEFLYNDRVYYRKIADGEDEETNRTLYEVVEDPSEEDRWDYVSTEDQSIDSDKTYYVTTHHSGANCYEETQDIRIDPEKTYYVFDEVLDNFVAVQNPVEVDLGSYYEYNEYDTIDAVAEPDVADIGSYLERVSTYYTLDMSSSMQNFLETHIWMDDYGLTVHAGSAPEGEDKYRIHIGTVNGNMPNSLYILDETGVPVGVYGETTQVGRADRPHIKIGLNENNKMEMGFYYSEPRAEGEPSFEPQRVAYIEIDDNGEARLHVAHGLMNDLVLTKELRIGPTAGGAIGNTQWSWYPHYMRTVNSKKYYNLALRWIGDDL